DAARAARKRHDTWNRPGEWADKLEEAGYDDHDSIVNASIDDLTAIPDVDEETARQMIELAQKHEEIEEIPEEQGEEEYADEEEAEEADEAEEVEEAEEAEEETPAEEEPAAAE